MDAVDPPVYVALLRIKPEALSLGGWATKAGLARNVFNDIRRHGNPKRETLQRLLDAIGVSLAQFEGRSETVRSEVRGAGAVGHDEVRELFYGEKGWAPTLPLYGSAVGGEYGDLDDHVELTELDLSDVLEYLARPVSLAGDPDAYAVTIVGDSMVPRFRPGERVSVSPRVSISIGDDVIVQLRGQTGDDERVRMVLIKELVRRNGSRIELRQHNPPATFSIDRRKVAAMHRVMGNFF